MCTKATGMPELRKPFFALPATSPYHSNSPMSVLMEASSEELKEEKSTMSLPNLGQKAVDSSC